MEREEQEETTLYKVVINHEEQYSIWPEDRENPLGWSDAGKSGPKQECLDYIDEVWTDMRPLSLRKKMEEIARELQEAGEQNGQVESPGQNGHAAAKAVEPYRDELVERLASREHPVLISRANGSADQFKQSIERGYVLIEFANDQGGTELGVTLDMEATDFSGADFQKPAGTVHLEGNLTLNYVKVRCLANVDLTTLKGSGQLQIIEE